jgi:hypothetical protein
MLVELSRVKGTMRLVVQVRDLGVHILVQTERMSLFTETLTNSQLNSSPLPLVDTQIPAWHTRKVPAGCLHRLRDPWAVERLQTCMQLGLVWYTDTHD